MNQGIIPGLREFLRLYPRMSLAPIRGAGLTLEGQFDFTAQLEGDIEITDSFRLRIDIPKNFPADIPTVMEPSRKIPRDGRHHVNDDGSLCLGSPLRLRWKLTNNPSLVGFAADCLIPYFYAIFYKLKHGKFPFGELPHGGAGLVQDYAVLFRLENKEQILKAFQLLGLKRRIANKKDCPCGCGLRLGKCRFRNKINKYRYWASRFWFRSHLKDLLK